jgi:hypothetical protein
MRRSEALTSTLSHSEGTGPEIAKPKICLRPLCAVRSGCVRGVANIKRRTSEGIKFSLSEARSVLIGPNGKRVRHNGSVFERKERLGPINPII